MTDPAPTATNPVKATRTTMRILEALVEREGAGVTELAERVDRPKSSVHGYLSTLRESGYVVKSGGEYHLGLSLLEFGSFARRRYPVYEVAKPEVRALAEQTGELANLLVEERGRGVYVCRETGDRAVGVDSYTGHRVSLHNTALGKAILANLPLERVDEIVERHGLPEATESTITDREELYDRLERVRSRGIAFDDEERLDGLRCVAAPILADDGSVAGAISVSGPTRRLRGDRFAEELPELLRDAAKVIELNLTYT
ncbi:MAG: IclR family transcriptional regulator [Salinirussus sp.]